MLEQVVAPKNGKGETFVNLSRPGTYRVELQDPLAAEGKGQKAHAEFQLRPEIKKIEILDPLVGGEKASSNQLSGKRLKDFEIQLRWAAIPGVVDYRIAFRNSLQGKKLMERKVKGIEYFLNRDKVFSGQIFYELESTLESGFILTSDPQAFVFDFLPPQITIPRANASVVLEPGNPSVLIVWQKTNFTDRYEVDISRSPDFKELIVSESRPENFYVLKRPPVGKIFTRIRSLAKNFSSKFGEPLEFTVIAAPNTVVSPNPAGSAVPQALGKP
ncbi:MAG: hypothetical protein A2070_00575 [Bdellovibrionales bacterium GWC1_52_8]|nr:MAG: hypothetical protein A2070_00575 [Bdellovibrionales bacterium GWC1_52_8]